MSRPAIVVVAVLSVMAACTGMKERAISDLESRVLMYRKSGDAFAHRFRYHIKEAERLEGIYKSSDFGSADCEAAHRSIGGHLRLAEFMSERFDCTNGEAEYYTELIDQARLSWWSFPCVNETRTPRNC